MTAGPDNPISVRKLDGEWTVFDWGGALTIRIGLSSRRVPLGPACCWSSAQAIADSLARRYRGEPAPVWTRQRGTPPARMFLRHGGARLTRELLALIDQARTAVRSTVDVDASLGRDVDRDEWGVNLRLGVWHLQVSDCGIALLRGDRIGVDDSDEDPDAAEEITYHLCGEALWQVIRDGAHLAHNGTDPDEAASLTLAAIELQPAGQAVEEGSEP